MKKVISVLLILCFVLSLCACTGGKGEVTTTEEPTVTATEPSSVVRVTFPEGYTIDRMGGVSNYTAVLKDRQNMYRRYRDISIVVGVLVYALSIIDAYVDAQLFDFDISDDLSINIEPQLYYNPNLPEQRSAELKLAISF